MISLQDLLPHELAALAGLVRVLVRADGRFTPQESAAIDRIAAADGATDLLWQAISTSAQKAQTDDQIAEAVASVKRLEAQIRIVALLDELAAADGVQPAETALLTDIRRRWQPRESGGGPYRA
jgi:hypothetical protein